MTRDELVEAVIPALGLSYVRHPSYAQQRARQVLDAIEPLIRAEARAEALEFCCADRDVDLRAKVEAIRTFWRAPDIPMINRDEVLALFDGRVE